MSNKGNNKKGGESSQKKIEDPEKAIARLTKDILHECRMIATGCTESCYELVEMTKSLMKHEELVGDPIVTPEDDDSGDDE